MPNQQQTEAEAFVEECRQKSNHAAISDAFAYWHDRAIELQQQRDDLLAALKRMLINLEHEAAKARDAIAAAEGSQ